MTSSAAQRKSIGVKLGALIAPVVAFFLVAGIAWLVLWLWLGGRVKKTDLDPTVAGALSLERGGRPSIPSVRLPNKDSFLSFGRTGPWAVHASGLSMSIRLDQQSLAYTYRFSLSQPSAAFSGADLQLAQLTVQLAFNPVAQQRSGAPSDLTETLRTKYGRYFSSPPVKISDSDLHNIQSSWNALVLAVGTDAQEAGAKALIDALAAAGKNSQSLNRADWNAKLAEVRALIPPDQESAYRDAIRADSAPAHPTTVPTP